MTRSASGGLNGMRSDSLFGVSPLGYNDQYSASNLCCTTAHI